MAPPQVTPPRYLIPETYAGDPNGNISGYYGQFCYDSVAGEWYVGRSEPYGDVWDNISAAGYVGVQVFYVGKHGDDANDGLSEGTAFLTIGAAIAAANALTPTDVLHFIIHVIDGGRYSETFALPDYTVIYAPGAHIYGGITDNGVNSAIKANIIEGSSGNDAIILASANSTWIHAERIYSADDMAISITAAATAYITSDYVANNNVNNPALSVTGDAIVNINFQYLFSLGNVFIESAIHINSASANVYGFCGHIVCNNGAGENSCVAVTLGNCDLVIDKCTGFYYCVYVKGGTATVNINEVVINAQSSTVLRASGGTINAIVNKCNYGQYVALAEASSYIYCEIGYAVDQHLGGLWSGATARSWAGGIIDIKIGTVKFYDFFMEVQGAGGIINVIANKVECLSTLANNTGFLVSVGICYAEINHLDINGSTPWNVLNSGELYGKINTITNYGANAPTTTAETYINVKRDSGIVTQAAVGPHDAYDVFGIDTIIADTNANNVTFGGFINGQNGQKINIIKTNVNNNLVVEHAEATGNQDVYIEGSGDKTIVDYGNLQLVCNFTSWFGS